MIEQYAEEISKYSGERYGFPIPTDTIIAIGMLIIEACIKNADDFVRAVKTPTSIQRGTLKFFLMRELNIRAKKASKLADDLLADMASKDEDELAGMYLAQQAAIGNFAIIDEVE